MHIVISTCIDNVKDKEDGRRRAIAKLIEMDNWLFARFLEEFDDAEVDVLRVARWTMPDYVLKVAQQKVENFAKKHGIAIKEERPKLIEDNDQYKVRVSYTVEWYR